MFHIPPSREGEGGWFVQVISPTSSYFSFFIVHCSQSSWNGKDALSLYFELKYSLNCSLEKAGTFISL